MRARGMADRALWNPDTCHCPESPSRADDPSGEVSLGVTTLPGVNLDWGGSKQDWRETGESGWGGALFGILLPGNVNTAQPARQPGLISILGLPLLFCSTSEDLKEAGQPWQGHWMGSKRDSALHQQGGACPSYDSTRTPGCPGSTPWW